VGGRAEANDYIVANSSEAMEALQKAHYSQTSLADINESFKAQKVFTSCDWKRLYSDGTVTNWLQQSTDFFMANAGLYDDINKNARRMPDISGRGSDQTVTAVCPRLPTIRGTPGTIAASRWLTERQHCRRGISPGIRRTWLAAATPVLPESAAIPAIPC